MYNSISALFFTVFYSILQYYSEIGLLKLKWVPLSAKSLHKVNFLTKTMCNSISALFFTVFYSIILYYSAILSISYFFSIFYWNWNCFSHSKAPISISVIQSLRSKDWKNALFWDFLSKQIHCMQAFVTQRHPPKMCNSISALFFTVFYNIIQLYWVFNTFFSIF